VESVYPQGNVEGVAGFGSGAIAGRAFCVPAFGQPGGLFLPLTVFNMHRCLSAFIRGSLIFLLCVLCASARDQPFRMVLGVSLENGQNNESGRSLMCREKREGCLKSG